MFSLQLIHDLAHGKYVDSPRDAKQLARFAAVCKEAYFLCATMKGIRRGRLEHPALDGREFRDFTRRTLDKFEYLETSDVRELCITEDLEPRIWAFQMMWNAKFEGWECIEAGRQLRAAEETGRARIAAARKRRRDEERQIREEMQSGERYRKYRKWAKEGDAMAVAFFEDAGLRVTELAD
jgi:hypothetical protein